MRSSENRIKLWDRESENMRKSMTAGDLWRYILHEQKSIKLVLLSILGTNMYFTNSVEMKRVLVLELVLIMIDSIDSTLCDNVSPQYASINRCKGKDNHVI